MALAQLVAAHPRRRQYGASARGAGSSRLNNRSRLGGSGMGVVRCMAVAVLLLATAGPAAAQELVLSVAVSLKEAVEELGKGFAAERPGVTLRYNFGASGDLQKQIEAGAPVDVFLSAAQRQMDDLERQ